MIDPAPRLDVDTFVWDLDGTLYEDSGVYDRYAKELANLLPPHARAAFLADWAAAKAGRGAACVGLGYDEACDRLFRFEDDRLTCYVDWSAEADGKTRELPGARAASSAPAAVAFGSAHFNIGDLWGLPDVLAAHHGLPREQRAAAFLATRAYMSTDAWPARPEPGLRDLLCDLAAAGKRMVAMTNSPAETTHDVLARLGLRNCFALVTPSALKPAGLARFLEQAGAPARVISIGDHYVNEIAPALRAGAHALYIDRHGTGLGAGSARCYHVPSIPAAIAWLHERCV